MDCIILTPRQAADCEGETSPGHRLEPVPLRDGSFVLPARVLRDPGHARMHETLAALPVRDVAEREMYMPPDRDAVDLTAEDRIAREQAVSSMRALKRA